MKDLKDYINSLTEEQIDSIWSKMLGRALIKKYDYPHSTEEKIPHVGSVGYFIEKLKNNEYSTTRYSKKNIETLENSHFGVTYTIGGTHLYLDFIKSDTNYFASVQDPVVKYIVEDIKKIFNDIKDIQEKIKQKKELEKKKKIAEEKKKLKQKKLDFQNLTIDGLSKDVEDIIKDYKTGLDESIEEDKKIVDDFKKFSDTTLKRVDMEEYTGQLADFYPKDQKYKKGLKIMDTDENKYYGAMIYAYFKTDLGDFQDYGSEGDEDDDYYKYSTYMSLTPFIVEMIDSGASEKKIMNFINKKAKVKEAKNVYKKFYKTFTALIRHEENQKGGKRKKKTMRGKKNMKGGMKKNMKGGKKKSMKGGKKNKETKTGLLSIFGF